MKPSEDLFEIIKSMTKSEKRYFKIYSSLQSGSRKENMNYLKLFNEIEKQTEKLSEYDEKLIKEKFKNDAFIKQLTFTKNYLYNQIFKSLFNFYSDISEDYELSVNLFRTKYLYRKGLFDQYFKSFKQAKEIALKYEKFGSYIDILKLERVVVKMRDYIKHKTSDYYAEEEETIKKIKNLTEYSKLTKQISQLYRTEKHVKTGSTIQKINEFKNHYLLSNESEAKTFQAKEYYYFLHSFLSAIEDDLKANSNFNKKRFELIESNPDAFKDFIFNIKQASLEKLIINAIYQKDFKTYKESFDKLNSLKSNEREAEKNFNATLKYIDFLNSTENLSNEELIVIIEDMYKVISSDSKIFDKDFELEFYYKSLMMLIQFNEFEKALKYSNIILNHDLNTLRNDILKKTRVLNLLIHFELKNYSLLKYLIKNTKYHINKSGELFPDDKLFMKFINKYISKDDKKYRKKVLSHYKIQFEEYKQIHEDKKRFESFDYYKWISQKSEDYR